MRESNETAFPCRPALPGPNRTVDWFLTAALLVFSTPVAGCSRQISVTKEMTWECAPEHNMAQYPEAQCVRFKFVEDPSYEDEISGRGLCDQLRASGKKVVVIEFETWGDSLRGLIGFREVSVDHKPIVDVGGWGSVGAHERVGPHPLEKLYKSSSR
jgi:hypothetical protein